MLTAWRLIQQWYDKPVGDGFLCKKCGLGDVWIIDIAVSGTLGKCSDVQYANTRFRNISDKHHWPESALMQQIALCFISVPQFSGHFFRRSYYWHMWWPPRYEVMIHWIRGISSVYWVSLLQILPVSVMIMAALAIFQAWICVGVEICKFLFVYVLKTFSPQKLGFFGFVLVSGWLPLSLPSYDGLDIIMGWNGHVEELEDT